MNDNALWAAAYAAAGHPIFPCWPENPPWAKGKLAKRPRIKRCRRCDRSSVASVRACVAAGNQGHGFHDATDDKRTVLGWWSQWPDALIGFPAGNTLVVDLDVANDGRPIGAETWAEIAPPEWHVERRAHVLTQVVRTPSGGWHIYLAHPAGPAIANSTGKLGPGVDIRGHGGYVIAPPSQMTDGSAYTAVSEPPELAAAPPWLVERLRAANTPARARTPATASTTRRRSGPHPYAIVALREECAKVRQAPSGRRNDTLNEAAYNLGQLIAGGELGLSSTADELMRAAEQCGLSEAEADRTIRSALRGAASSPRTIPT